jgi:hypothetical protein
VPMAIARDSDRPALHTSWKPCRTVDGVSFGHADPDAECRQVFWPTVFMNVGPGGVAADRIWAGLGSSVGVRSAAGSLVVQL